MYLEKEIQKLIDEKEKNNMIRYRFEFDDENGNTYSLENKVRIYTDLGDSDSDSDRDELARALNIFMQQIGYGWAYDKDMIFLESVTESEYEALLDVLEDMREERMED